MGYRTARQGDFTMTATEGFEFCSCEDFALSAASLTKEFKSSSSYTPISLEAGAIQPDMNAVNNPLGRVSHGKELIPGYLGLFEP